MVGIFKQKNPVNFLLLLLFSVLIKLPMFVHPHIIRGNKEDSAIYAWFIKFLGSFSHSFPRVYPLLAFVLLFLQSILITRFVNSHRMINTHGYLPGMAYMLITSLFPEWNYLSAALIVNTIFLFALYGLLKIYNQQQVNGTIYNIGLTLGIASFIFIPSLTFIIWIFFGLLIMRPLRLNEWVLCIVGIATPFYFYAVYLIISSQWSWQGIWPGLALHLPKFNQSPWFAGSAFFLIVPFFAGSFYIQNRLRRMLIQVRKGWSLLLLYLLAAIFTPFFSSGDIFENLVLCTIPFACFHASMYMYSEMRVFILLIFWLTVAFVVSYQYYGPGWQ